MSSSRGMNGNIANAGSRGSSAEDDPPPCDPQQGLELGLALAGELVLRLGRAGAPRSVSRRPAIMPSFSSVFSAE